MITLGALLMNFSDHVARTPSRTSHSQCRREKRPPPKLVGDASRCAQVRR